MNQIAKATRFKALHKKSAPLVLYNIWDAGGAKTLADAGARAVATGSWSVAAAHGFADGEAIPLEFLLRIVERIVQTVDLPVTVDFEGGYATEPDDVAANVRKVIQAGAIGINFEDQLVQGEGLYPISVQAERIKAIREMAIAEKLPLFVNARTDLFLGSDPLAHADMLTEALERAAAYAKAGADGFFVPGLTNASLIQQITEAVCLPVNVMMIGELNSVETTAKLGVSRASFGPGPYFETMDHLTKRFTSIRSAAG
ncbi:isocitrate lyase/phosphoenolpyruvate mutase family protein [Ruegeria sp. EL01]|jgi:2-methylisocitrate lyase-like PEP mutase family enzyme|uniref:isocitrate lyase/PEP mutase family protein n=1 Tax=Ruegeria sp. EL01 TaxID=2107578 RepID=UPI000EA827BC|nr:isocitrate lyase/phosphoenolpyruvate mutase family protein [Ruegeria sp. EL01]